MKRALFRQLYTGGRSSGRLTFLNRVIVVVIVASILWAVLGTEPVLMDKWAPLFRHVDLSFGVFFLVEYLARLWVVDRVPCYRGWKGRLRYMVTPFELVDLFVLLSFFAGFVVFTGASGSFVLRLLRVLRILAIARLGRFSKALRNVAAAFAERRYELLVSFFMAGVILLFSSTLMYIVEGPGQPEAFGSIPRALWWSVVTLTTVGYGDVYPVTWLGRICAAVTAITAVGVIAIPAGILAGAFTGIFTGKR
jgi:voltage-gated potassium channel